MSRIDSLLERQAAELDALQTDAARRVLAAAKASRRELREALEAALADGKDLTTPYTVQHTRVMLAQAEAIVARLAAQLDADLATTDRAAGEQALGDLLDVIRVHEPDFTDAGGRVELRALTRIAAERGLLIHSYSTRLYSAQVMADIQREIAAGILQGLTRSQVVSRITRVADGTMARHEWRAELIARMEANRAYGELHQASLEETAAEIDEPGRPDPLCRQMEEHIDARNSPASRAANEIVAAIREPFRVPVADVERYAAMMKRRPGIVPQIRVVNGYYEVPRYPFHFGERGRQVPYRSSWDGGTAMARMVGPQRRGMP